MKFTIKDGHPKMTIIWNHKKFILADLKEIPDELYKDVGKEKNIYGIIPIKEIENGKRSISSS